MYDHVLETICDRLVGEPADEKDSSVVFNRVFDAEIINKLAGLTTEDYTRLKVHLSAWMIINPGRIPGMSEKGLERRLDKLVEAANDRLREKLALLTAVSLGECIADCPEKDEDLNVPPGWYLDDNGLYDTDAEGNPKNKICSSRIYISGMTFDKETKKSCLELAIDSHGWNHVSVPASASDRAFINAVKNMGAIVYSDGMCANYIRSFFTFNHKSLQVKESSVDLFQEFVVFYWDNLEMFNGTHQSQWGKVVYPKEQEPALAILPKVLKAFAKEFKISPEQLILTWEKEEHLVADTTGNMYKPVNFMGQTRRMVVLTGDWLSKKGELKVVSA